MPQRYKVRLGDGTFVSVDADGLRDWEHDPLAVAQAAGNPQWRPIQDVLVDEENAARLLRALVRPTPKKQAALSPPEAEPGPAADPAPPLGEPEAYSPPAFGHSLGFGEPAFGEPVPTGEPLRFGDSMGGEPPFHEPHAVTPRQSLQVLADEPSAYGSADAPDPGAPKIRMKPVDDEPSGFRSAWDEGEEGHEGDAQQTAEDHLQGPLLTLLAPLGAFLSRVLEPVGPVLSRWSSGLPSRRRADSTWSEPTPEPAVTIQAGPGWREALGGYWSRLVAGFKGLVARFQRTRSDVEPEPEFEPEFDLPVAAPSRAASGVARALPPQREPPAAAVRADAPAHVSQLPVVPLAEAVEPRVEEDVYEEERPSAFLGALWLWTQRIVTLAILATAALYAYRERGIWFPKAADVGQTVFTAIDREAHSRERAERLQRALEDATARLPQLNRETILLVFAHSPIGVLEPPAVFQQTREAAERGLEHLAPADAEELRGLEQQLEGELSAPERRRLEEYDQARTRRAVFPFENPYAMDLVAKGARSLPQARLDRLRALLQQAVSAGMPAPAEPGSDEPR
jgi:hypothetical protein